MTIRAVWLSFFIVLLIASCSVFPHDVFAAPSVSNITDNRATYTGGKIPRYEKFESTFSIGTAATNLQFPFDSAPPIGIIPNIGITVDGIFTAPDGSVFRQPGFYYQNYQDETRSGAEWFYPTNFNWKIRFASNQVGTWSYRIEAIDQGGTIQSSPVTFDVVTSASKGFLKVSTRDPRYFEFDNGDLFTGLGYTPGYKEIDWENPASNESRFNTMKQDNINLIRLWLSQWAIYGSAWGPWYGGRDDYDGYVPRTALYWRPENGGALTMLMRYTTGNSDYTDACRMMGAYHGRIAVKPNTNYKISITYRAYGIAGPRVTSSPNYGLVAKVQNPNTGDWHKNCYDPNTGVPVTSYGKNIDAWTELAGSWNSGTNNFLPMFYLGMENVTTGGYAYIRNVSMKEDLGGGQLGPEVISKPSVDHHLYFEQRNSYAFDKTVELAHKNDVYIRPVILEKQEDIFRMIDDGGSFIPDKIDDLFYANGRTLDRKRWMYQAWWRYLQARWGYSPNIHSWELINEGNPGLTNHYILTDEMGKYFHCGVFGVAVGTGNAQKCTYDHPNDHMVSTSFWHSFPATAFWKNANYPNVDFADVHAYISTSNVIDFNAPGCSKAEMEKDSTVYQSCHSTQLYNNQINKPIIRGEAGMDSASSQSETILGINRDTQGVWYHNYLWASLNFGGLYEEYWWVSHIYNGSYDHRHHAKVFGDFLNTLPLNNGKYADIFATITGSNVVAWGQKDITNGNAHVWVHNKNNTWKNDVDNPGAIGSATGTVSFGGFQNNKQYTLETWNTYTGTKTTSTTTTSATGVISLSVSNLTTDTAFKVINPTAITPSPTGTVIPPSPTLTPKPGDVDGNGTINLTDLSTLLGNFGKPGSRAQGDLDGNGNVNLSDLSQLLTNFGK